MLNLNRIEVIGNLTRDPEQRFTTTNQSVVSVTVATNRRYKDQTGNWVDSPAEYHDIVIWAQLGERCAQILKKGDRIYVAGRLQTRSWEAQDGQKKYKTEIIADSVIGPDQINKNMGGAMGGDDFAMPDMAAKAPAKKSSAKASEPAAEDEINIEDIPF